MNDAQTKLAEYALTTAESQANKLIDSIYNQETWNQFAANWAERETSRYSTRRAITPILVIGSILTAISAFWSNQYPAIFISCAIGTLLVWYLRLLYLDMRYENAIDEKIKALPHPFTDDRYLQMISINRVTENPDFSGFGKLRDLIEQAVQDPTAKTQLIQVMDEHAHYLMLTPADKAHDFFDRSQKLKDQVRHALHSHRTHQVTV